MHILPTTFFLNVSTPSEQVFGQLLASGVLLLGGFQDIRLRARSGAAFWFFMALAFCVSALATAIWVKAWSIAAFCALVLCFEAWLVRRWWSRRTSM
jgi:hypothetical protein